MHTNSRRARATLAITALALGACQPKAPPSAPATNAEREHAVTLTEASERAGRIETARLERSTRGPSLALPAVIEADPSQVARVGARVEGRVYALRVAVGATVERGAPLVEIDTVELHQVSTEYFVAQARMRQARDALTRARALVRDGVGAAADLRRAEADERVAAATLHESEEHLHFLGLGEREIQQLRSTSSHGRVRAIIRSPMAGRVSALPVSIGQVVNGTDTVAVLGDAARVWVAARVFQVDLARVRVGASVRVEVDGAAEPLRATIATVSDVLDPETRTATARAALDNNGRALRDGMSVTARVDTEAPSALWVDERSIVAHDGARGAFVRTGAHVFEFRPVRIDGPPADRMAVAEGLREGDELVTNGAFLLLGELERASRGEED
ncbi:MAG: efflux RND transporter periplasmic adaptor subunit [Myxococcales bacterium]|nr:efflux RND transporter periplasmic adaptor subunit [Myxococcales bacterium]